MEDTREHLIFEIFIIGKSTPIREQQIIQGRLTLENRLREIKNAGVFEKTEASGGVWYPPHRIQKVEYRHVNGPQ